tara:strand:+ start:3060 stop:3206 length:147 start_codon:yes stop_codon:yes gene_type:complete
MAKPTKLTKPRWWGKHAPRWLKRNFWKRERANAKRDVGTEPAVYRYEN